MSRPTYNTSIGDLIATAFWPLLKDGRYYSSTLDFDGKYLFAFGDFPPHCILHIEQNKLLIQMLATPIENLASWKEEGYAIVSGSLADALAINFSLGDFLKAVLCRRVKLNRRSKWLKLANVLSYKKDLRETPEPYQFKQLADGYEWSLRSSTNQDGDP